MNDAELKRRLTGSVPRELEEEACERAWQVVRTVFAASEPIAVQRQVPWRPAIAIAFAAAALGVGVSPAGPAIGGWLRDTIGRERVVGTVPATPSLVASSPGGGRLLVTSPRGIWVVSRDGSRRFLGAYQGASWSPRGLFVVAWGDRQLVALEPDKTEGLRWSLSREPVADARWAPSGYRIAYRAGSSLRVVAGDGTGDRELARDVLPLAPAWRPGDRHVLAYADGEGRVTVVDVDTGQVTWRGPLVPELTGLDWSEGERVLAISRRGLWILSQLGTAEPELSLPDGETITEAAVRPESREIAYAVRSRTSGRGSVFLRAPGDSRSRLLVAGLGSFRDLTWSPDGRTLLVTWAGANEWLFLPADGKRLVRAVSEISQQFDPGRTDQAGFPRVDGWVAGDRRPDS